MSVSEIVATYFTVLLQVKVLQYVLPISRFCWLTACADICDLRQYATEVVPFRFSPGRLNRTYPYLSYDVVVIHGIAGPRSAVGRAPDA